jgi:uncharacterized protein YegL
MSIQDSRVSGAVLPIYLLVDVSASMQATLQNFQDALTKALDVMLAERSFAASQIRLSIICVADDAQVALPLTPLSDDLAVPTLVGHGATYFSSGFARTATVMRSDIARLRSEGLGVHRPVVLFFTDGLPVDDPADWHSALRELRAEHPTIIAVGAGETDPRILTEIATDAELAFMAGVHTSSAEALTATLQMVNGIAAALEDSQMNASRVGAFPEPTVLVRVPDFFVNEEW